jgi:hypothetical protein
VSGNPIPAVQVMSTVHIERFLKNNNKSLEHPRTESIPRSYERKGESSKVGKKKV